MGGEGSGAFAGEREDVCLIRAGKEIWRFKGRRGVCERWGEREKREGRCCSSLRRGQANIEE